jgi:hypothetical protein
MVVHQDDRSTAMLHLLTSPFGTKLTCPAIQAMSDIEG